MRVWNVARTAEEIASNPYMVDPLSLASGQRELVLPDYTNTMKIEEANNER